MSDPSPFKVLSSILEPYAEHMIVKHDTEENYYLEETLSSGKAQMFAAVQIKKRYTSFHLFPVYCEPELLTNITPALRKRMQGKSCFNFASEEQIPRAELESLVATAFQSIKTKNP